MISGIQKLSLVDYPDEPAFVIFLGGCNFRCPFCYNRSIVEKTTSAYDTDDVLNMIETRSKIINAVVITGGEPTLYGDSLISLILKIKELGFKVKLDTNGTNPTLLKRIIVENLIDFVAMDIKNIFSKYNETTGVNVSINNIKESIEVIEMSDIPYQFRTTINKTMHTINDINEIKSYLKDVSKYKIQTYTYNKEQIKDIDFGVLELEEVTQ